MNLEKAVFPADYKLDVLVRENTGVRNIPRWWHGAKRAIDVGVAAGALIATAPVLVLAAAAIAVVSPGSPVFLQPRVGKDGRLFRMWKLRTMDEGAHLLHERMLPLSEVDGPVLKIRNDPRLHLLGALLRRTSIDELPNFINVLRGEMSVVGPRPPLPSEVAHYDERALRRLRVKPGVTCLWQINGRSNVSFEHWMELDNRYIDSWTPLGDLGIIARTIPAVMRGDGAH
ncbi:MAG: sugar transferase [Candidatus Eremiobacteraeota bacterium]|nr:sugar transferase [Candidatus Eremiobacteraeota bacterium]